ncbi:MAG: hypothetical protein MAG795_00782 [Candidatus Woesearchaeota archaeon]|nr:hypothetical protein [Candidatus Woesearchaeota archaeon]
MKQNLKHIDKTVNKEEEESILNLMWNQYIIEKVQVLGKEQKIQRSMTFLEAKERFFEKNAC